MTFPERGDGSEKWRQTNMLYCGLTNDTRQSVRTGEKCGLGAHVHDGHHRAAALRPLVHGIDRDEHGGIADGRRRDAADRALGMAVVVDV